MCRGVGGDACGESAQSASMLVDGARLRWCGADETTDAPPRFEDSGTLEIGVRFPLRSNVALGFSPLVLSRFGSDDVDPLWVLEPKLLTLSAAFL